MTIMGIIPHRKLMELKNSGTVNKASYESAIKAMFKLNEKKLKGDKNFAQRLKDWFVEPSANDMLNYAFFKNKVCYLNNQDLLKVKGMCLSQDEVDALKFITCAYLSSKEAEKVLSAFRNFDEVFVDNKTARAVNWLLYNKYQLQTLISSNNEWENY